MDTQFLIGAASLIGIGLFVTLSNLFIQLALREADAVLHDSDILKVTEHDLMRILETLKSQTALAPFEKRHQYQNDATTFVSCCLMDAMMHRSTF